MKKLILIMLVLSSLSFAANVDSYAGASLNKKDTKKEYTKLMKDSKKAIKENDWFLREEVIDEIELFLDKIEKYEKKGAKSNTDKFKKNLEKGLEKLIKVDGIAGASLNPKQMMPKYKKVAKLADDAIESGEDKDVAIREVSELLEFISKWKEGQSEKATNNLSNFEKDLNTKLEKLKIN